MLYISYVYLITSNNRSNILIHETIICFFVGPFGTMKSPAIILSGLKSRIVGCVGGGGYPHRLLWFDLKKGKKHVCRECGQVYQLQNANEFEVDTQVSSQYYPN